MIRRGDDECGAGFPACDVPTTQGGKPVPHFLQATALIG